MSMIVNGRWQLQPAQYPFAPGELSVVMLVLQNEFGGALLHLLHNLRRIG